MVSDCKIGEDCKGFDPGFKLFGKTIPVGCCVSEIKEPQKSESRESSSGESKDNDGNQEGEEEVRSSIEAENNNEGSNNNTNKNGEKPVLKKPDKLLPCPRCESMDTKFCYYNNYNVNQPRHFCKNCQRYWTAGGTLRNVPVGAGRRKNKHSAANPASSSTHYRQIRSASDVAALGIRTEDHEGGVIIPSVLDSNNQISKASGVLNFGPQARPNCEEMEISCGSSVTGEKEIQCNDGHAHNPKRPHGTVAGTAAAAAPFLWPFGWSFAPPTVPVPPWAAVPWPLVTSHIGAWSPPPWITAPWPVPACNNSNSCDSVSPDSLSPTLGKRAQSEPNGSLWVPKTLRIDDPGEAAKSSFWTTLGLGDKPDSIASGRVMFKAFEPKSEGMRDSCLEPAAENLRANPAAFSRSLSFQESN